MFTGLVDDVGSVTQLATTLAGLELRIACRYEDLREGESISVNGVCLTVRDAFPRAFTCAAMTTTLAATTIGEWRVGRRVNLERAMRADDRFGGHIVQGHVDGVARVARSTDAGDALLLDLALPEGLSELSVERGSVAVDGVSLTIAALPAPDVIRVSIIDYTRRHTTLGERREDDKVHVEADIVGKYVRRLVHDR